MNIVKSTLQFKGYRVIQARYSVNGFQSEGGDVAELKQSYTQDVRALGDNTYSLTLGVEIGTLGAEGPLPFYATVELEGRFVLSNIENADELMKRNATSILFPYLRSTLSALTTIANINPVFLPTINLAQMFEDEEKREMEEEPRE